ncbi:hypothetical protein BDP27DRAFT_1340434 [Rhodocollybia butyracea]|uniref:Uncharacterized protein n=1 Tax=Rhodocollybia butyracea TaxID=206335 RepID=A0A9P5PD21_9AGAR|nr:hypothetical protein BDP27DRAFT_1340434 [Rhodocollybia butyracea]
MPSTVSVRRPGSLSTFGRSPANSKASNPRRSSSLRKTNKTNGLSTLTFEEPESTVFIDREMVKNHHMDTAPSRRGPVRIDQDGPWSVSVAESPHDQRSYSLYIKTPTHNLTLTRTAMEIIELDHKLHDSIISTSKLPALPLDPATIPAAPKRKSAFLNTLSRLASPSAKRSIPSPSVEQSDPFASFALLNATLPVPSATSTALAAYFTTVANLQPVRQARAWKRFVRVRTDDLESTRVERAIKRVRSDLAAHGGAHIAPVITEEKPKELPDVPEPAQEEAALPPSPSPVVDLTSTPRVSEEQQPSSQPQPQPQTPTTTEAPAPRMSPVPCDESSSISTAARSKSTRKKRKETSSGSLNGSALVKKKSQRKVVVDDFEMLRVLGKGCAGKVLLVRHKATTDLYAMKAITKRHVLAHQELQHTLTEQAVLKRMAAVDENGQANPNGVVKDPFVVKLWWSFHDKENLFLVMDFHPGGDLATQLARWGRLGRDRARFYAAEIVEGVEGLHAAGVIYRDLKPENILIGADGHIVLTDFGLSKEFPRRRDAVTAPPTPSGKEFPGGVQPSWMVKDGPDLGNGNAAPTTVDMTTTFCGTAEYLAPEVIQALPYSYEIDWWSFGTMLYEMLTGITPFWANNHSDMYVRVLQDELQFPDERSMDQDTKSLIRGLLQRNPALRICEPRIKRHPYFSMIDWSHVYYKRYIPPYIPPIDPSNASDTQNFDDTFLDMEPVLDDFNNDIEGDNENTDTDPEHENEHTDTDRTDGEGEGEGDETNTTPSQSRSSSLHPGSRNLKEEPVEDGSVDVFDGYSFKGRHSMLIDDEDGEEEDEGEETDEEEEEEEEEGGDEEEDISSGVLGELTPPPPLPTAETPAPTPVEPAETTLEDEDELPEPKTPEARPKTLPPADDDVAPPTVTPSREPSTTPSGVVESQIEANPRTSKELPTPVESTEPEATLPPQPPVSEKPPKQPPVPPKPPVANPVTAKAVRAQPPPRRKERSGVLALDQYLSDGPAAGRDGDEDEDVEDEEDEDWDFIEADGGEDRNGAKGTSLFARGVVDRYRLAVFRKASTPSRSGTMSRSVSEMSTKSSKSKITPSSSSKTFDSEKGEQNSPTQSPSPSIRDRRGRNQNPVGVGGLTFRGPRQFLRPKSASGLSSQPPSSYSSKSKKESGKSLGTLNSTSTSGIMASSSSSSGGLASLLTPTSSVPPHSLKSKESAVSVGAQSAQSYSESSDTSINGIGNQNRNGPGHGLGDGDGDGNVTVDQSEPEREAAGPGGKHKKENKKLKKYRENAEKVLSIFSTPRQTQSTHNTHPS